jgi:hypothetical protein
MQQTVHVGVRISDLGSRENEGWKVSAELRGQSFARGHHFFDHYRHMQQQAKLFVPELPTDSRTKTDHIFEQKKREEANRVATLARIDLRDRRRLQRLQETRSLLQRPEEAKLVGRALNASCSLPSLARATLFGDRTEALQLLNRRVDVNQARKPLPQESWSLPQEDAMRIRLEKGLGASFTMG